jgi:3-deoxy-manno-octulosonate cytidylyltransferase (CMP-KDO synthetase)
MLDAAVPKRKGAQANLTPIVLIPARLDARRLPGKPLLDIAGLPLIVHVWRCAVRADIGPVVVAAADPPIVEALERASGRARLGEAFRGARAVLTDPAHASGTDRIFEALARIDAQGKHDVVINLQGDLPQVEPGLLKRVLAPLADPDVAIATLAAPIADARALADPNVVKVKIALGKGERMGRALSFRRHVGAQAGPYWHHIGIYAYRRAALERFVKLKPSPLERREKLEQLRALDAGFRIGVAIVDKAPLSVDTPADLGRIREIFALKPEAAGLAALRLAPRRAGR